MSHKKIMEKSAKDLKKDASYYKDEMKHTKSKLKKKHERTEMMEAEKGAKVMRKMSKKAHEY